jgi:hypothetical protein
MTAASVINRVLLSAADRGVPGRDSTYGYGLVDAHATLTAAIPAASTNPLGDPGPPRSSGLDTTRITVIAAAVVMLTAVALAAGFLMWWRKRRSRTSPPSGHRGAGSGVAPQARMHP